MTRATLTRARTAHYTAFVSQKHANALVPKEHIVIGMRVVRGPDWQWHRQDGTDDVHDKARYGKGTVVDAPVPWLNQTTHAVRVLWDATNKSNIYRWGAHEKARRRAIKRARWIIGAFNGAASIFS